ncbi:MAG: YIP1 family protein [Methanoregula sp.]|jgi:hypothetical protein|nr:YIP1 family protein [Methanoregula sp.]
MTFSTKITDLLFHPDTFFTRLENEETNLVLPILIVLLNGVGLAVAFAAQVLLTVPVAGRTDDEILITLVTSSQVISAFIIPFIMWVVASISIRLIPRILSGTGCLKTTFQNRGYGLFPSALYNAVNPLLVFAIIPVTIGNIAPRLATLPLLFLALVSGVVTLWTWYLWICGTLHAQRITSVNAFIAVTVATIIQFVVMMIMYTVRGCYLGLCHDYWDQGSTRENRMVQKTVLTTAPACPQ